MAQKLVHTQQLRQSPQQYLISTMVQATADDLVQLINQEVEKNFTLEVDDPRESDMPEEGEENASMGEDANTNEAPEEAAEKAFESGEPFFEYDDDSPSDRVTGRPSDDNDFVPGANTAAETSFREDLKAQLALLDIEPQQLFLANYIIESLDDSGYLTRPLSELAIDLTLTQHLDITEEDLEEVLVEIVQEELEPAGIGARDLRECLLLQLLDRKATPATRLAYAIVDQAFDDLAQKRYDRLQQGFGIGHQALVDAIRVIRSLMPKPGGMQSAPVAGKTATEVRASHVHPDFSVHNEDGALVVTLNDGRMPQVRVSADQEALLQQLQNRGRQASADERSAIQLLRDNLQSATQFIDAIRQRRITLVAVMEAIVQMQREYFLSGQLDQLRPMVLQDVAERSGYDISTISRVSNSKYVETDFGLIAVKDLFTTGIRTNAASSEGSEEKDESTVSNVAVMEALRGLIDAEDKQHPLTDEQLSVQLKALGYPVARRTVMKYRERLGFPVARLRKEL